MINYNLLFYDFEVFHYDWLVVLIDYKSKTKHVIVNDIQEHRRVYNNTRKSKHVWVGYNSRNYDSIILKGLLLGKDAYELNDKIINQGLKEYQILGEERDKYPLLNFDIATRMHSLKQLEGFMGQKIKESDISFNLNRKLTKDEINETIEYCTHDVEQTIEVFENLQEEFDSQMALIETFDLPLENLNKTKAQLVATILNAKKPNKDEREDDEFDIIYPDTLILDKYSYVLDWFKDPHNHNKKKSLYTTIAGIPHVIGWGGLHGSLDNYIYKGNILCADVASLYPSIMIEYGLLSRNVKKPELYKEIRDTRLKLKAQHNPMQLPYKIVLNSTYGASGDKYNNLYDPRMCRSVCVTGQLLLIDLIEKIEPYCNLIQSNTDGIYLSFDDESNIPVVENIMHEWEKRTRLSLEIDFADGIFQKDVNNYLLIEGDTYKSKGSYLKKLTKIDYDLPILNKALINYFLEDKPLADTINECDDLIEFQKIVKVSKLYAYATYGEKKLNEKVLRVFASNKEDALGVFKAKIKNGEIGLEKIANTPDKCFINNEYIIGTKVPDELDREYYIALAEKRLNDFFTKKTKSKEKNEIKGVPNEVKNKIETIGKGASTECTSFSDIIDNMKNIGCNKTQLRLLINLDYLLRYGDANHLKFFMDIYIKYNHSKSLSKDKLSDIELEAIKGCYSKETAKKYMEIDNEQFIVNLMKLTPIPFFTNFDRVHWQMKLLGYTEITIDNAPENMYTIEKIEIDQWNRPWFELYHIKDGKTIKTKVDKKYYKSTKCEIGDNVKCIFREQPKRKKVDGKWYESEETETILKVYAVESAEQIMNDMEE